MMLQREAFDAEPFGRLSDRTHGRVGLWVGESAGADFANLRIRPAGAVAR